MSPIRVKRKSGLVLLPSMQFFQCVNQYFFNLSSHRLSTRSRIDAAMANEAGQLKMDT